MAGETAYGFTRDAEDLLELIDELFGDTPKANAAREIVLRMMLAPPRDQQSAHHGTDDTNAHSPT